MILVAGCQSLPQSGSMAGPGDEPRTAGEQQLKPFAVPDLSSRLADADSHSDLWARMQQELEWQSLEDPEIDAARKRFLGQSNYLSVVANRANYYLYYIVEEVEERDMPMEIALIPLVESTLNPFASSPSSAAGLWQIMPATGEYLGLNRDWWFDGRKDLRDSTRVALNYLEELHDDFDGDWLLALAAYNSGKGRVSRARKDNISKGLPADFWSLKLPRETRNYVPKLIALTQIVADPQQYGVTIPRVANAPSFEVVGTGGQLEMSQAAQMAGIELDTLRAFNPGQLRWATSPNTAPELLVPVGSKKNFEQRLARVGAEGRVRWRYYRIERGDSLIRIARKFKTEVGLLRQVNDISGNRIRAGDTMMIPHGGHRSQGLALAGSRGGSAKGYRVRRGDSLYGIAGKFNVSVNEIVAWNDLDPAKYLQPGQELTVYVRGG